MAYDPKSLSVLAYANGFTLWHYRTEDSRAAVSTPGYFDAARDMLRFGDVIMIGFASGLVSQFSVVPCNASTSIMLVSVQ